jgi:ADP-ribose pyrophosphatase YjhB (NUDIX family)
MTNRPVLFSVGGGNAPETRLRNSAKAIIIRDNCLLLTENQDDQGSFFLLPGGGQNPGETLAAAVQRECIEEIGATVTVGPLLYIREYISRHHEFAALEPDVHQIEFMFSCRLAPGSPVSMGKERDAWQIGIKWVPLSALPQTRLYPRVLCGILTASPDSERFPVYLGDVN